MSSCSREVRGSLESEPKVRDLGTDAFNREEIIMPDPHTPVLVFNLNL